MPRMLPLLLFAALPLSACAPEAASTAPPAEPASLPAAPVPTAPVPATIAPSQPPIPAATAKAPGPAAAGAASASIQGAIREGNRPPPALRICAHPVDGGAPTCADSPAGATEYRIAVAPGRYYLMGWVQAGELKLIAHASQIRCIRAPCPPDALIEVEVAAGEQKTGIDLSGGYVDVPAGWPRRP